jgi:type II secretory pathway pseudopilin PulG
MTESPLRSSAGFTYIAALVMVVIFGIMAAQGAQFWTTRMQRERESELIYKGTQIRDGMRRFYGMSVKPYGNVVIPGAPPVTGTPPPDKIPPAAPRINELKDLLQPPTSAGKKHFIRPSDLLVKDPATGKSMDWSFFKDTGGRVTGVFLNSEGQPMKQDGFPSELFIDDFKGKKKYSDWVFICDHYAKLPAAGGTQQGAGGPTTGQPQTGQPQTGQPQVGPATK